MRMVWLALFCLMALAITVVAKIGMSPYANVDVSKGMPSAKAAISRETSAPDTVAFSSKNVTAGTTKADKLEVSYTNEAPPEVKSVKSVAIILPATAPKEAGDFVKTPSGHDFEKRWLKERRHASNARTQPTAGAKAMAIR
jgi:hypothetical protein